MYPNEFDEWSSIINDKVKRGRPKSSKETTEAKEKIIIEAAKNLFRTQGFNAVSMRKIAREAGMGTMTLYQYFANKNQLLHHIWGEFFEELFIEIASAIDAEKDEKRKFKCACSAYLDYWFKHPDRFRMVYLNEDRADTADNFFLNHANMEERLTNTFMPVLSLVRPKANEAELLAMLLSTLCHIHGIALNLITISEYPWPKRQIMLDFYFDNTFN